MAAVTQVRILVTAFLFCHASGMWKLTKGEFHSTRVVAFHQHNVNLVKHYKKMYASAGNRTRINCLEGSYADHYTTDAFLVDEGYFSL